MIRIIEPAGIVTLPEATLQHAGRFLKSYDPEAYDGRGLITTTDDPAEAMRFSSTEAAWRAYGSVPACHPVRKSDGRPNRPLTAFTVEILNAPGMNESSNQ